MGCQPTGNPLKVLVRVTARPPFLISTILYLISFPIVLVAIFCPSKNNPFVSIALCDTAPRDLVRNLVHVDSLGLHGFLVS